ncbi:MAG: transcription elongation factor GreA [Rickettsiales bacterium]
MSKNFITQNGYIKLQNELKHYKNIERPEITKAIQIAREFGDLSENADYSAAKEKQSSIESRILFLENLLTSVEIYNIKPASSDSDPNLIVQFSATVTLLDLENGDKIITYSIVSEYESDLSKKLISYTSPMAQSLIGSKKGDIIEVSTNNKNYEILKIEYKEIIV